MKKPYRVLIYPDTTIRIEVDADSPEAAETMAHEEFVKNFKTYLAKVEHGDWVVDEVEPI